HAGIRHGAELARLRLSKRDVQLAREHEGSSERRFRDCLRVSYTATGADHRLDAPPGLVEDVRDAGEGEVSPDKLRRTRRQRLRMSKREQYDVRSLNELFELGRRPEWLRYARSGALHNVRRPLALELRPKALPDRHHVEPLRRNGADAR